MKRTSLWAELEAAGLHDIVMHERVRANRILINARGGPLSVKKDPTAEPIVEQLGALLTRLVVERLGDEAHAKRDVYAGAVPTFARKV